MQSGLEVGHPAPHQSHYPKPRPHPNPPTLPSSSPARGAEDESGTVQPPPSYAEDDNIYFGEDPEENEFFDQEYEDMPVARAAFWAKEGSPKGPKRPAPAKSPSAEASPWQKARCVDGAMHIDMCNPGLEPNILKRSTLVENIDLASDRCLPFPDQSSQTARARPPSPPKDPSPHPRGGNPHHPTTGRGRGQEKHTRQATGQRRGGKHAHTRNTHRHTAPTAHTRTTHRHTAQTARTSTHTTYRHTTHTTHTQTPTPPCPPGIGWNGWPPHWTRGRPTQWQHSTARGDKRWRR